MAGHSDETGRKREGGTMFALISLSLFLGVEGERERERVNGRIMVWNVGSVFKTEGETCPHTHIRSIL